MSTLKDTLVELEYEDVTVACGFDEAAVGVVERCGQPPIVIYDHEKCVDLLIQRDGMTAECAVEHMSFNVTGAWVGPGTPGWLMVRFSEGRLAGD